MIGHVRFSAYGKSLEEIRKNAAKQWREFIGDDNAPLPYDCEFSVREHSEKEYVAEVTVRVRLEN